MEPFPQAVPFHERDKKFKYAEKEKYVRPEASVSLLSWNLTVAACSEAFAVLYSFLQLAQAFVRAFSLPLSALAQALSLSFELPFILPFLSVFVLFKQIKAKCYLPL